MKEDVLEQLVDDYLKLKGYFTRHNIKFAPKKGEVGYDHKRDSVPSDIDVIGFNPQLSGYERVCVVSCKSWQGGFDATWWAKHVRSDRKVANKPAWKHFRELVRDKWTHALMREVERCTGQRKFTYITAVTKIKGDGQADWEKHPQLSKAIEGNPICLLTLAEILNFVRQETTTTPAPSELGRLVQLLKSAELF